MNKIVLCLISLSLLACSTGTCRSQQPPDTNNYEQLKKELKKVNEDNDLKVKVYKPDGSKQCGEGSKISLIEMAKQLVEIKIYSQVNKSDGQIRIQSCGTPTGNSNVYEINKKDLELATKYGFKEWIFE